MLFLLNNRNATVFPDVSEIIWLDASV